MCPSDLLAGDITMCYSSDNRFERHVPRLAVMAAIGSPARNEYSE